MTKSKVVKVANITIVEQERNERTALIEKIAAAQIAKDTMLDDSEFEQKNKARDECYNYEKSIAWTTDNADRNQAKLTESQEDDKARGMGESTTTENYLKWGEDHEDQLARYAIRFEAAKLVYRGLHGKEYVKPPAKSTFDKTNTDTAARIKQLKARRATRLAA